MSQFEYIARDAQGRRRRGRIDAASREVALAQLSDRFAAVVSLDESAGTLNKDITIPGVGTRGVRPKDLALVARQLSTMVGAGLPLTEALDLVSSQTQRSKSLGTALTSVRQDVVAGSSLTEALALHPKVFPQLFVSLVEAGEASGELDRTLASAAGAFERQHKLRAKIKSAMTYPVVVLAIAFIAVIGIVWTLVPKFEEMFAALGGQLPLPTRVLVAVSHQMPWLGPLIIAVTLASVLFLRASHDKAWFRRRWDPIKLRLPIIGPLARKLAVARFADALSLLTNVGVPITSSLDLVGRASGNWVIEQAARQVREDVESGRSIQSALLAQPVFPELTTKLIGAGEAAGDLPSMLEKVAEFYNDDVTEATEQLTSIIEPVMIVVIGAVIGGIVISLYLPMFQINTLISNS